MKNFQINYKFILASFVVINCFPVISQTVFGQTEKLGVVSYKSPQGWTKDLKQNIVGFSNLNQKTGKFCIISLYGATSGTKNSTADFTGEWNNLVVKNMKAEAVPQTDTQNEDGWTLISGGSAVVSEVGKAVAFLTVISGYGKTISILAVFNDPVYVKDVDDFIKAIDIDKSNPPANNTTLNSQPTFDGTGDIVVPQPVRQLTTADLAGVWIDGPNRMTTEYVYSGSGKSAGRDTTAFKVKTTFKSDGTYSSFFNSVRKKYETESDIKTGPYSIDGLLLSIQGTGYSGKNIVTTKYVIRGWLELPDMTVLQLAGPWYDNAEIPEVNFTDFSPESKFRGVTRWIRLK
jgi:hypothetical protein